MTNAARTLMSDLLDLERAHIDVLNGDAHADITWHRVVIEQIRQIQDRLIAQEES